MPAEFFQGTETKFYVLSRILVMNLSKPRCVSFRSKTWGGVELEKFDFKNLKLVHYEKKIAKYPLYMKAFWPILAISDQKLTVWAKIGQKMTFRWFLVAPLGATTFLGFLGYNTLAEHQF